MLKRLLYNLDHIYLREFLSAPWGSFVGKCFTEISESKNYLVKRHDQLWQQWHIVWAPIKILFLLQKYYFLNLEIGLCSWKSMKLDHNNYYQSTSLALFSILFWTLVLYYSTSIFQGQFLWKYPDHCFMERSHEVCVHTVMSVMFIPVHFYMD